MSRYTEVETITREQYYQLLGLLTLATQHRNALDDILRTASAITGEEPRGGGHTDSAVWGDNTTVDRLLELLSITVQDAT